MKPYSFQDEWIIWKRAQAHKLRCRGLPPLRPGEIERLRVSFGESGGRVTICSPRYLVPCN